MDFSVFCVDKGSLFLLFCLLGIVANRLLILRLALSQASVVLGRARNNVWNLFPGMDELHASGSSGLPLCGDFTTH